MAKLIIYIYIYMRMHERHVKRDTLSDIGELKIKKAWVEAAIKTVYAMKNSVILVLVNVSEIVTR